MIRNLLVILFVFIGSMSAYATPDFRISDNDGNILNINSDGTLPISGGGGASVSDDVYDATWDGDTTDAPSKNAVYDKIETIGASSSGWSDGGTNVYTSTTTDTVGVGTTTPSASVEMITKSGTPTFMISSVPTGDGDRLIVTSSGNVGIGTVRPGGFFEVSTAIGGNAYKFITTVAQSATGGAFLSLYSNPGAAIAAGNRLGGISFGGVGGATNALLTGASISAFGDELWTTTSSPSMFSFRTVPSGSTTSSERMIIKSDGNIAIGTTTPGGLFTVGSTSQFNVSSAGAVSTTSTVSVADDAYAAGWNASTAVPTKNAVYDKIETLGGSSGWTDGGTNVYTSTTTDMVGIGTTTPTTTLEVIKQSSLKPFIVSSAAGGNGDYLTVSSSGNVGIGTLNPVALLSVGSAGHFRVDSNGAITRLANTAVTVNATQFSGVNAGASVTFQNTSSTASSSTVVTGSAATSGSLLLRSTSGVGATDSVRIQVGNNGATEALRVITDGNVGIGTTKPASILNVVGDNIHVGAGGTINTASGSGDIYVESDLEVDGTAVINNIAAGVTVNSQLVCTADGTNCPAAAGNGWTDGGTNIYTSVTTDTIGLGTTTPNATIEIVKQSTSTLLMVSSAASGDGDYLKITSGGNIGIGTLLPGALLEAQGQIRGTSFGIIGTASQTDFSNANGIALDGNSALMATPDLIVASTSNVGVGTSVPTTKFHVVGAGTFSTTVSVADDAYAAGWNGSTAVPTKNAVYDKVETLGAASGWTDGGTAVYTTTSTDNVGIGTTSPQKTLDVKAVDGDIAVRSSDANECTRMYLYNSDGDEFSFGKCGSGDADFVEMFNTDGNLGIFSGASGSLFLMDSGNVGIGTAQPLSKFVVQPIGVQTIASTNTVTADSCGSIKTITSGGAVTTNTTNTFTAFAEGLEGCVMSVCNTGSNNITLDNNANFASAGGADVVLTGNDCVTVGVPDGQTKWYQLTPIVAN